MNVLATFSGARYHDTTQRIVEDSPKFGAGKVLVYDDRWLRESRPGYWAKTEYFRTRPMVRGVDWFCFKPFVILDAFRRLNDGDVLLFIDADTFPIADLAPLYDTCRRDGGAMLFNARGCVNKLWTKRDVFILMGCDEPAYHDTWQAVARFLLFQKGGKFPVEKFIGEWLGFTANPFINTFEPSVLGLPDYPGFRENRCEQSVLTNLSVKYGVKLYREACEFGCWDEPEEGKGGCVPVQYHGETFGQTFSQQGGNTYRPGFKNEAEGSAFRNVKD